MQEQQEPGFINAADYDGALKDKRRNPVYALLLRYNKMSEQEIKNHIAAWWFGADPDKLLSQAKRAVLIKQQGHYGDWQLA